MEVHLMHADGAGNVAGVTVFLKTGSANDTVQKLWEHMPANESKELEIAGVEINPAGLLPRDVGGYYTYRGSQTAPPCTENVTWIVLKMPVEISAEQIREFAKLYPHDVRPIQPLHGRIVKESQ
jgi:carbonic anhydrase